MRITFHGGVRTTTGSCHFVETAGARFLVDCGMFQGGKPLEARNAKRFPFAPGSIDFVLVTHAHMDHVGLLPKLVREGFRGTIYGTRATQDVLRLVLLDAAHIQEAEARWHGRKAQRARRRMPEPLYGTPDAEAACALGAGVSYHERIEPAPGVSVVFRDAGHILGSSFVEVVVAENGAPRKVVFSGDVGNRDQAILRDPEVPESADALVLESTYGDRAHKPREDTLREFADVLTLAWKERGNVVIPCFAVGRTQEILYQLHRLHVEGRLPPFPVYVDSPMAISATAICRDHAECFDEETLQILTRGDGPFDLPRVRYTREAKDSMAINAVREPVVIISASGMCEAGRIRHHLKWNLWRENAHVVFVGYQAEGTLGRLIVDGARRVKVLGEDVAVGARVHTIGGLSAHADQQGLIDWARNLAPGKTAVYVVHGEEHAGSALAQRLKTDLGFRARMPAIHETVEI